MPISDFSCPKCEIVFEKYHSLSEWDNREVECPECGSTELEKYLGNSNVGISYSGVKSLRRYVPDGFKDVLKAVKGGTPEKHRGNFRTID